IMTTEESRSSKSLLSVSFLLFGLSVLNGFVWSFAHPGHLVSHEVRLSGPYSHEQGNAFVVDSPVELPSDETDFQRSRVELYEAGTRLGPPHSAHAVIRDLGSGAFSHWRGQLYFSTSDNSDPNRNERTYFLRYQETLPISLYVLLLLVDYFAIAF